MQCALRPFVADLSMASIPGTLMIPKVQDAVDEQGNAINEHTGKAATKLIANLKWYAEAMKKQSDSAGRPS